MLRSFAPVTLRPGKQRSQVGGDRCAKAPQPGLLGNRRWPRGLPNRRPLGRLPLLCGSRRWDSLSLRGNRLNRRLWHSGRRLPDNGLGIFQILPQRKGALNENGRLSGFSLNRQRLPHRGPGRGLWSLGSLGGLFPGNMKFLGGDNALAKTRGLCRNSSAFRRGASRRGGCGLSFQQPPRNPSCRPYRWRRNVVYRSQRDLQMELQAVR